MDFAMYFEEQILFAPDISPTTNRLLQKAVLLWTHHPAQAEQLFWQAHTEDPDCLQVYFALYKFYANQKRLDDAERVIRMALVEASRQGGFPMLWRHIVEKVERPCLYTIASGHFYLFSLKALAFITLRRGYRGDALAMLDALAVLDPEDRVGGSVIRALAEAVDGVTMA